jgi:hypothetical protein
MQMIRLFYGKQTATGTQTRGTVMILLDRPIVRKTQNIRKNHCLKLLSI